MRNIIVYQEKPFLMGRIKKILSPNECKLYEAASYIDFESYLKKDIIQVDMIIAELNYRDNESAQLVIDYLKLHPETKLIVFTSDTSRESFLSSIPVGASDYIINNIKDDEIKARIKQHLSQELETLIPTHLILNLTRYISGELIKASKGNYELTIAFSTILNEKGYHILKEDTSGIANAFSNVYWDTDSILIYGYNHLLSFFPFCKRNTISQLDKKLQQLFAAYKAEHIHLAKCEIHNTYVTFPDEGLNVEAIIRIVTKKIEKSTEL